MFNLYNMNVYLARGTAIVVCLFCTFLWFQSYGTDDYYLYVTLECLSVVLTFLTFKEYD